MKILLLFVCTLVLSGRVVGWDHEELEIFDIVEEVNQNFYELMGINQVSRVNFKNAECQRYNFILL